MGSPDFHWQNIPFLELWREQHDSDGKPHIILESYPPRDSIEILKESLANNEVSYQFSLRCIQLIGAKFNSLQIFHDFKCIVY